MPYMGRSSVRASEGRAVLPLKMPKQGGPGTSVQIRRLTMDQKTAGFRNDAPWSMLPPGYGWMPVFLMPNAQQASSFANKSVQKMPDLPPSQTFPTCTTPPVGKDSAMEETDSAMEVQDASGLTKEQQTIRLLEAQVKRLERECEAAKWARRQAVAISTDHVRQASVLQSLRKIDKEKMQRLVLSNHGLQNQVKKLKKNMASRAALAFAAGARARAVHMRTYGDNARVNSFIRSLTTREMRNSSSITQTLINGTSHCKQEWESLWKGLGYMTDADIREVYQECDSRRPPSLNPEYPENQARNLTKLFERCCMKCSNISFQGIFESQHMPEKLRGALYTLMEREIDALEKHYSSAEKHPCSHKVSVLKTAS